MKLGDGSKVTTHRTPECSERAELATECASLLARLGGFKGRGHYDR
jgi:hypothetical protein